MDDGRLAEELIRVGREAGLAAVGICDASRFEDTRRILVERRSRGWAAGMQFTYRRPERSTDPQVTLPGAAALVVGACRYERDEGATPVGRDASRRREVPDDPDGRDRRRPHGAGEDETGGAPVAVLPDRRPRARVAMYSWVDHYRVLRDALGAVADHLLQCGWRAQVVADDNALVDRAAAVRAGLGWYGKNTNVLLPGAGSWFVLGSVLTDAPLTAGRPTPTPVAGRVPVVPAVPDRLPDRGPGRAGSARRPALPGLAGAGARRLPPGVPGSAGRSPLRMRRLPDQLPGQPGRHRAPPTAGRGARRPAHGRHPLAAVRR